MTKAEAAEIILGGDPWRSCDVCSGTGYHDPRMQKFCKACRGTSVKLKLKYRYAYMKLDMEPPSVTVGIARQLALREARDQRRSR